MPRSRPPGPYLCHCDRLDDTADDPNSPIVFDESMNEYHIESRDGRGHHIISHCPFCGGRTPASRRQRFFARPPREELQRLRELTRDIRSFDDAIVVLGTPDWDFPDGIGTSEPAKDGNPPTTRFHRAIWYLKLSDTANVCVAESVSGGVYVSFQHKALAPDALPPAEPPMRARDLRAKQENQGLQSESKKTLYCVMCGKTDREAAKMIANVNANICDECVSDCVEALNSI